MLRAKAVHFRKEGARFRDRLLTGTDRLGKLATIPVVVQTVNWANRTPLTRSLMEKTIGVAKEAALPPYAPTTPGDATRGAAAYGVYCASCHGVDGRGGAKGGSVVDGAYLGLVSDQALRTAVICGRTDLGMPDWRGYVPGRAMSDQEITDVVAWLVAQRPEFP
jgi:mono/diheme cytochrome c family protein